MTDASKRRTNEVEVGGGRWEVGSNGMRKGCYQKVAWSNWANQK